MNPRPSFNSWKGVLWFFGLSTALNAQMVDVLVILDDNSIAVGNQTTLRAFAQITADQRQISDRIFSWYVDLLNADSGVATGNIEALVRPTSDNHSTTSSSGVTDGAGNQRGIFDTFIDRPGASKNELVELFNVPIRGLTLGEVTFQVREGSGENLALDFLIARAGGGDPVGWDPDGPAFQVVGGYTAAQATLTVVEGQAGEVTLAISVESLGGDQGNLVTLTFDPLAGRTHTVEFRDSLNSGSWQPVAGDPHNSGQAFDVATASQRFYRVRVE